MSTSNSTLDLSARGQFLAAGNDTSEIFDVIRNLYDAKTNPGGYVSLGVAENDMMHNKLAAYIEKTFKMPTKYLTYLDGGAGSRRLTKATARFLNRRLNPINAIEPEHIIVTNGCSSALEGLAHILADPNDGFLLGQPYYRSFIPDLEMRSGAKVIGVPFGDIDPLSLEGVSCYERAILRAQSQNQPLKALILCHPNNPLGRCYAPEVMTSLMRLCQKHNLHFISDEIYAFSIFHNTIDTSPPATPFTSALSLPTTNIISPHLVHTLWGMSKDFGANGLRIGFTISQSNPSLTTAMACLSLYTYPSMVADHITSTILEDDAFTDAYIRENSAMLSDRFAVAVRYLRDHGIGYAPGVNAAFFITADLGKAYTRNNPGWGEGDLTRVVKKRLVEERVFLVDSNAIGSERAGWFRIVFTQDREYLLEGLRRIVVAVGPRRETELVDRTV